ncbi:MAG TPA: hypothetical protein VII12_20745, partial [Thermoanaerobaculia bacterium]
MRRAAVLILILVAACRTTRPPNAEPLAPLTAISPGEAAQQLAVRRAEFRGERSLIRLRAPQISARGQLQVDAGGRMLLTVYTPIGTTAARLYVDGDDVMLNDDLHSTTWRGKASDLPGSLSMFANTRLPLLLVGLPPAGVDSINYAATGMQAVTLPEVTITYDPPVYPPRKIVIIQGEQRVEIEHQESFVD